MGRKSNSAAAKGIGVLILIGFVINYWHYIIWPALIFGVGYIIYKSYSSSSPQKAQPSNNNTPGVTFSFDVSTSNRSRYRSNVKESINFFSNEQQIDIAGITVPAYLLYVGTSENTYPHLVVPSLSVGSPDFAFKSTMGYWPSYDSISGDNRATYLRWLADGRKFPDADIGFVFLYFYGLEYRAISQGQDQLKILNEAVRLYKIYGSKNNSFARYCGHFIAWLCASDSNVDKNSLSELSELYKTDINIKKYLQPILFEKISGTESPDFLFDYCLGKLLLFVPRGQIELIDSFKNLFRSKTANLQIGEDSFNKPETHALYYRTATSLSLNTSITYRTRKLDARTEKKLKQCWQECETELNGLVKLNKEQSKLLSLFLHKAENSNQIDALMKFMDFKDYKTTTVLDVLTHLGFDKSEKLTPTEAKKLCEGLESKGIWVEPDARLTNKTYKMSDAIVLTRENLSQIKSEQWQKIIPLFDLSISIALAEGDSDSREVNHTIEFMTKQFKLGAVEQKRLQYRAIVLKENKISVAPLAKKISESMNLKQGQSIAKFLFSIAALDGTILDSEIKALDRTYKAFNFPADTIDELISEFSTGENKLVVLKAQKKSGKKGSAIPKQPDSVAEQKAISLDSEALSKAFAEANEVASILATVFVDENEEPPTKEEPEVVVSGSLTEIEEELLNQVKSKPSWDISEIEDMCRQKGLMFGAFVNKINEWSEQVFGYLALEEDGDQLIISNEFLKESGNA